MGLGTGYRTYRNIQFQTNSWIVAYSCFPQFEIFRNCIFENNALSLCFCIGCIFVLTFTKYCLPKFFLVGEMLSTNTISPSWWKFIHLHRRLAPQQWDHHNYDDNSKWWAQFIIITLTLIPHHYFSFFILILPISLFTPASVILDNNTIKSQL